MFAATGVERRRALRRAIDAMGGERQYRQWIKRLKGVGDEALAGVLELLLLEYRERSTRPPAGFQARSRPKKYAQDDISLLVEAENRARQERSGKTAFELIRETVIDAIAQSKRGSEITGAPAKPAGASVDAIVRRLFGVLRPRKPADSALPFEFPALQQRITPYRRSVKSLD
jgi:hypothetical protein